MSRVDYRADDRPDHRWGWAYIDDRAYNLSDPRQAVFALDTIAADVELAGDPVGGAVIDLASSVLEYAQTAALVEEQERTGSTGTDELLRQWNEQYGPRNAAVTPVRRTEGGNLTHVDLSMPSKPSDEMTTDELLDLWRKQYGG